MNDDQIAAMRDLYFEALWTVRAVQVELETSYLEGRPIEHYHFLRTIDINGPATASEMARRYYVTPQTAWHHLSHLHEAGMVSREVLTGGQVKYRLSDAGQSLVRQIAEGIAGMVRERFAELDTGRVWLAIEVLKFARSKLPNRIE